MSFLGRRSRPPGIWRSLSLNRSRPSQFVGLSPRRQLRSPRLQRSDTHASTGILHAAEVLDSAHAPAIRGTQRLGRRTHGTLCACLAPSPRCPTARSSSWRLARRPMARASREVRTKTRWPWSSSLPSWFLGCTHWACVSTMQRTQPEGSRSGPGDTDRTLHSLRRFVRLAASGNPSILMSLWAPVFFSTEQGVALQALGPAFVGRHVIPRYRGYMQSQAGPSAGSSDEQRPRAKRRWWSRGVDQRVRLRHEVRDALRAARLPVPGAATARAALELPMQGEPAEWLLRVRRGEVVAFEEWWERALELWTPSSRSSKATLQCLRLATRAGSSAG